MYLSLFLCLHPLFGSNAYSELQTSMHTGEGNFFSEKNFGGFTSSGLRNLRVENPSSSSSSSSSTNLGSTTTVGTKKTLKQKQQTWVQEMWKELAIFDNVRKSHVNPKTIEMKDVESMLYALDVNQIGLVGKQKLDPIKVMLEKAESLTFLYGKAQLIAQLGVFLYTMDSEKGGPWGMVNTEMRKASPSYDGFNGSLGFIMDGFMELAMTDYHAKPNTYYRGVNKFSEEELMYFVEHIDQQVILPAFISASLDVKVARHFQKERDTDDHPGITSVRFVINYKPTEEHSFGPNKRTFAVDINAFSQYPEEKETLFGPYHIFYVLEVSFHSKTLNEGRATIVLECVGVSWPKQFYQRVRERFPLDSAGKLKSTPDIRHDIGDYEEYKGPLVTRRGS